MLIDLKCWHCGKTATIEVMEPPQFAFQIAGWANDIGWRGHIDMMHGRSLVFCSDEHADAERTKAGHFRLRPKRANAELTGAARHERETKP